MFGPSHLYHMKNESHHLHGDGVQLKMNERRCGTILFCSGPQGLKVWCVKESTFLNFFFLLLCNISFFSSPLLPPIQWFVFINFRQSRDVRVWNVGNKDFLNIGTVTRFDVWLLLLVGDCGNQNSKTEKKCTNRLLFFYYYKSPHNTSILVMELVNR